MIDLLSRWKPSDDASSNSAVPAAACQAQGRPSTRGEMRPRGLRGVIEDRQCHRMIAGYQQGPNPVLHCMGAIDNQSVSSTMRVPDATPLIPGRSGPVPLLAAACGFQSRLESCGLG